MVLVGQADPSAKADEIIPKRKPEQEEAAPRRPCPAADRALLPTPEDAKSGGADEGAVAYGGPTGRRGAGEQHDAGQTGETPVAKKPEAEVQRADSGGGPPEDGLVIGARAGEEIRQVRAERERHHQDRQQKLSALPPTQQAVHLAERTAGGADGESMAASQLKARAVCPGQPSPASHTKGSRITAGNGGQ